LLRDRIFFVPQRKRQPVDDADDFDYEDDDEEYDVGDVVEEVLGHPRVRKTFEMFTGVLDRFSYLIDQVSQRTPGAAPPRAGASAPRPNQKAINPFLVLGFSPGQKLTTEMIKARKRKLAAIYHPDTGDGDEEAIRMVNAAADMLLRKLGGQGGHGGQGDHGGQR
jgi:hypothetical protein